MSIRNLSEIRTSRDRSNQTLRFNRTAKEAGIDLPPPDRADRADGWIGRISFFGLALLIGISAGGAIGLNSSPAVDASPSAAKYRPLTEQLNCADWKPGQSHQVAIFAEAKPDGSLATPTCLRLRDRREPVRPKA